MRRNSLLNDESLLGCVCIVFWKFVSQLTRLYIHIGTVVVYAHKMVHF